MIISNLSLPLLGLVDTAVMGHLDAPHYLGAVAVGATIFGMLFVGMNFLRMGTTGLAAQAFGGGDADRLRTVLGQAVITGLGVAVLLLVLQVPLRELALRLIDPGPAVRDYAAVYFNVRIWSAPLVLVNYALVGWFLGVQNARAALYVMLATSLSNIVLDLAFVLGLHMDVAGVAAATVLAEGCGLLTAVFVLRRELAAHPGQWRWNEILDRHRILRVLAFNRDLLIRTLSLVFAFAFLTAQGARMGDTILAANAVLLNFQNIASYALDGLAHAAEALVGRAAGARDRAGVRRVIRLCLQWSAGFAVVTAAVFALLRGPLINAMTSLPEVREVAFEHAIWLIAGPLISVWSFLLDGVFVGTTRARQMRNAMLFSTLLVYLPAWYLLRDFGNHGLWAAFMIFMAARGLSMAWYHRRLPLLPAT